jgi:hypothetical protein
MLGVHGKHLVTTVALIVCTWSAFVVLVAPFLHGSSVSSESPSHADHYPGHLFSPTGGTQHYYIALLLCTLNLVFSVSTATIEPGILPRRITGSSSNDANSLSESISNSIIRREATVLRTNYCKICDIWRPHRARHCKYCDNCVDIFDHHCPVSYFSIVCY